MTKKPRVAVIGIGRWGKNIFEALLRNGAEIPLCLHAGSAASSEWLRTAHPETQEAASYEQILSDASIEAVAIATPIATHFDLAMKALKAGKHVFVEKPAAQTPPEIAALIAEARTRNKRLATGFVFLHHPVFAALRKELQGTHISSVRFEWNKWGTFGEDIIDNLLSHEASLIAAIGLSMEKISSRSQIGIYTPCDIIDIAATLTGGVQASIHIDRVSPDKRKTLTIVSGSEASNDARTIIWHNDSLFVSNKDGVLEEKKLAPQAKPLDLEMADFVRAITTGSEAVSNGELSLQAAETCSAVRKSK